MQKNGWGSPLKLQTSNLGNGDVAIGPNQAAPAFLRKEAKGMQPTKKKLMNINLEEHSQVILDSACKIKPNAGKKLWHSLWNIGGSSLFHGQLRYQHPERGNSNPRQWLNKKTFSATKSLWQAFWWWSCSSMAGFLQIPEILKSKMHQISWASAEEK